MISISIKHIKNIQASFIDKINAAQNSAIKQLKKIKTNRLNNQEKDYLKWVINEVSTEDYLLFTPDQINDRINVCKHVPIKIKINPKSKKKKKVISPLKDKILEALNYKELRGSFLPNYFKQIGIKSCVYCNSMLTVSVESANSSNIWKTKAKFQIDHYHNKNHYPFLSISLFNLYPACASCNLAKGVKKVKFDLYSEIEQESNFHFKLTPDSKANYALFKDSSVLDFIFIENKILPPGYSTFQSTFDIQGIYDTQKDIIEDLINKKLIYNESYQKQILKSFPSLFRTHNEFKNFILGNYSSEKEIHKRPMAKFMQDIAKNLELI
jgi:hypothetical protein